MKTSLKILTGLLLAIAVACGGEDNPENLKKKPVVTVNPSATNLNAGETFQFSATVTDAKKNPAVTWAVTEENGGTITAEGKYTAPQKAGTYHVVATSAENVTSTGQASVTVRPLNVVVSPGAVTVATAGTTQLSASVTGTTDTAVTWSVKESGGGSVTATGVYTAPTTAGTYHVVATSHADGTTQGSAAITVTAITVAITPASLTVGTAGSQAFTAEVTGTANTAVTWAVEETGGGSINSGGYYTAPAAGGTFHVVATSVADPSKSATAEITVQDVTVALSPASADLDQGASATFTATVGSTGNTSVIWTVQEANGGQVSSSGVYTAPAAAGTYHVVATSVADPGKAQTAEITVHPVAISISTSGSGNLDQGATRDFTATVTGTVNPQVTWSVQEAGGGTVNGLGTYTAPNAAGTFHVVATAAADATQTASAAVDVNAVAVQVSPTSVTLEAGQVQGFSVIVTGTVNTTATWTVQEANGGSVDASGSYTAPGATGTYHVVVTSASDAAQSATATVTVPVAQALTYEDPASTGWRLVKNAASTQAHLVLDLVGPAGTTGKGVALTLNTNPGLAGWAKVAPADTELIANLAFPVGTAPALLKGVSKNGTLVSGVFQKGGAAVDVSVPVASVALDFAGASSVSGTAVPVSVVKAEALDASGVLAPISVAVGTIKAH
jgi:hypothetical protein